MNQYDGYAGGNQYGSADSDAFWRGEPHPAQPTSWQPMNTGVPGSSGSAPTQPLEAANWAANQQTPVRPDAGLSQSAPAAASQSPETQESGTATAVRPRRKRRALVPVMVGTALLTGVVSSAGTYAAMSLERPAAVTSSASSQPVTVTSVTRTTSSWTKVAASAAKSVVAITTSDGAGSGVVWDEQGHIVTNNHVIAGSQQVGITFSDGQTASATVVGTDASTDLAVLKVDSSVSGLSPIARATTAPVVGDDVMAIGNPLGLSGTATTGIVSAMNRPLSTSDSSQSQSGSSSTAVVSAIQTSAAINPGNSGGALINSAGELIGITNAIASLSSNQQGQSGNIGIGFAIPVSEVTRISTALIDSGKATHGYLGVSVQNAANSDAGQASAVQQGAQIAQVESDGPSHDALQSGDVVTGVNGISVVNAQSLIALTRAEAPGTTVELTVIRNRSTEHVQVTLGSASQ